jgi:hypothetical protein
MTGVLNMSGTQTITFAGFAGIEYYNAAGTWQGYVGTENNSGNLRYNSRLGTHTWYANSTSIGSWNASALNSLVALQQNGNQVLHAGNYNSYAPTLTGGGASGTWGISITGTSSNITAYTINQNLGTGNSPTFVGLNLSGNLLQLGGVNALNRGATWTEFYDPSGATKLWLGNNASIYMNASNYYLRSNDSSATWVDINASLLSHTSSLRAPIFYDSNNTGYYVDAASTSVFNRLNLVGFDSTGRNYSREWIEFPNFSGLYSPNNGAHFYPNNVSSHGPWVIQGSRGSYGGIFDDFADVNGIMYDSAGNGGAYREANGRWYFYYSLGNDCMGIGTSTTSSAYSLYLNKGVYAQSRIDATIFYDTNDTNYYVDPNSNSKLVNLGLGGATPDVRLSVSGDAHISTYLYMGGTAGSSGSWSSRLISSGGATTLNTSTFLVDRTGYGGGGSFNMDTAGNCFASSSFRAPIFYDSNDTTYYIDPASFTNVFGGIQNSGAHATSYIQNRLLAANNGASTGEVQLRMWCSEPGVTWDWAGFGYNVYNDGGSPGGFGRPNTNFGQAYMRFGTSGDLIFYNTTTGASRSTTMQLHSTGYVTAFQSSRAPIFYDTDNTGYYLDPNSTTALRTVGSWRADSATWDGEFSGKIQYHSSYWYFQSASGWFFRNSGGTNVMTCDSSGNVTFSANVTAYSDRHKKDNIVTLESAASYLDRIDARRFDWKDSGRADIGFIAQEVEESGLSMFVHENQIIDPDTDEVLDTVKSLDYGRMTAVLWQAVKELKAELNALRAH